MGMSALSGKCMLVLGTLVGALTARFVGGASVPNHPPKGPAQKQCANNRTKAPCGLLREWQLSMCFL